jgi:hypothetical protein
VFAQQVRGPEFKSSVLKKKKKEDERKRRLSTPLPGYSLHVAL